MKKNSPWYYSDMSPHTSKLSPGRTRVEKRSVGEQVRNCVLGTGIPVVCSFQEEAAARDFAVRKLRGRLTIKEILTVG